MRVSDVQRVLPLAQVEINHEIVKHFGYDYYAVAKTIHNAYLARIIHNSQIREPMEGSLIIENESPQYHNEHTAKHSRYVGSFLRYWTGIQNLDSDAPEYVKQTLGYESKYIYDLLYVEKPENPELTLELKIKREIFRSIENWINSTERDSIIHNALVLWGYFHDLGKIFRPYIKILEKTERGFKISKDESGNTVKTENALNEFTIGYTPEQSQEHEYLELLTLQFIDLFVEGGMVSTQLGNHIKEIHSEYATISFMLKGEGDEELSEEFSYIQKLALTCLAADELGKGIIFNDVTGHSKRMSKLNQLKFLIQIYL